MPLDPDPDSCRLAGITLARLDRLRKAEMARYLRARTAARAGHEAAQAHWLAGVPMQGLRDWPAPFPLSVTAAQGARLTCAEGDRIDDFWLGDGAALFGHAPDPVTRALRRQARQGPAALPPADSLAEAGRLLSDTFGAFRWQIAAGPAGARGDALQVARAVTGRDRVLVFDRADDPDGRQDGRTLAVPFNDLTAVEAALARNPVAAILTEPVMTAPGMVLPEPGFLDGLQMLAADHGALFILDETQGLASGHGGFARGQGLSPDMLLTGPALAGGLPLAVWGMTQAVADRFAVHDATRPAGQPGIGATPAALPLGLAALVATLSRVMTPKACARMTARAESLARDLTQAIDRHGLPWHVARSGARLALICAPTPPRNGAEAAAVHHPALLSLVHLALLNRGVLIAPGDGTILVSPATKRRQIKRLIAAVDAVLALLSAPDDGDETDTAALQAGD